jgi:hypothetical protein
MSGSPCQPVPFTFHLSDKALFTVSLPMQVRVSRPFDITERPNLDAPPPEPLAAGSQGFAFRNAPVDSELPALCRVGGYLRYVPLQYSHCYIDLSQTFDEYKAAFSSKTRSTIGRKVRKFAAHSGGSIRWKTYAEPGEMREFIGYARKVSEKTYQEKLLGAGLPDSEAFLGAAEVLAAEGRVRAYVLFDGERPVAYMYCPARGEALVYAYTGYDPEYARLSVGTVLQWLALEQLFAEGRFRYFDFTEGQSDHKRRFGTHQTRCANVFFVRRSPRNMAIVYGHLLSGQFSERVGRMLDRLGLKTKIRHIIRFGR